MDGVLERLKTLKASKKKDRHLAECVVTTCEFLRDADSGRSDEAKVTAATGFFAKALPTLCKANSSETFDILGSVLGIYYSLNAGSKGKESLEKLEAVQKLVAAMFEGLKKHFESSLDVLFDMPSDEKQRAETLLKSQQGQAMEVLTPHFSQVISNKKESPQMKKTLCDIFALLIQKNSSTKTWLRESDLFQRGIFFDIVADGSDFSLSQIAFELIFRVAPASKKVSERREMARRFFTKERFGDKAPGLQKQFLKVNAEIFDEECKAFLDTVNSGHIDKAQQFTAETLHLNDKALYKAGAKPTGQYELDIFLNASTWYVFATVENIEEAAEDGNEDVRLQGLFKDVSEATLTIHRDHMDLQMKLNAPPALGGSNEALSKDLWTGSCSVHVRFPLHRQDDLIDVLKNRLQAIVVTVNSTVPQKALEDAAQSFSLRPGQSKGSLLKTPLESKTLLPADIIDQSEAIPPSQARVETMAKMVSSDQSHDASTKRVKGQDEVPQSPIDIVPPVASPKDVKEARNVKVRSPDPSKRIETVAKRAHPKRTSVVDAGTSDKGKGKGKDKQQHPPSGSSLSNIPTSEPDGEDEVAVVVSSNTKSKPAKTGKSTGKTGAAKKPQREVERLEPTTQAPAKQAVTEADVGNDAGSSKKRTTKESERPKVSSYQRNPPIVLEEPKNKNSATQSKRAADLNEKKRKRDEVEDAEGERLPPNLVTFSAKKPKRRYGGPGKRGGNGGEGMKSDSDDDEGGQDSSALSQATEYDALPSHQKSSRRRIRVSTPANKGAPNKNGRKSVQAPTDAVPEKKKQTAKSQKKSIVNSVPAAGFETNRHSRTRGSKDTDDAREDPPKAPAPGERKSKASAKSAQPSIPPATKSKPKTQPNDTDEDHAGEGRFVADAVDLMGSDPEIVSSVSRYAPATKKTPSETATKTASTIAQQMPKFPRPGYPVKDKVAPWLASEAPQEEGNGIDPGVVEEGGAQEPPPQDQQPARKYENSNHHASESCGRMHDGEEPTTANELVGIQEKVVSKDRPRASALTGNNQPVSKARSDDSGAWMMDEDGPDADRVVLVMNPRSDIRADLEHPPRAAKITTVTDLLSSSPVRSDPAGDGAENGAHNFEGFSGEHNVPSSPRVPTRPPPFNLASRDNPAPTSQGYIQSPAIPSRNHHEQPLSLRAGGWPSVGHASPPRQDGRAKVLYSRRGTSPANPGASSNLAGKEQRYSIGLHEKARNSLAQHRLGKAPGQSRPAVGSDPWESGLYRSMDIVTKRVLNKIKVRTSTVERSTLDDKKAISNEARRFISVLHAQSGQIMTSLTDNIESISTETAEVCTLLESSARQTEAEARKVQEMQKAWHSTRKSLPPAASLFA